MMGIAQKVARDFTDAVRARGQSYHAKGRVSLISAVPDAVTAKVRGTAQYRVRLRIRGGKLYASCTCPYFGPTGEPCKHLWATILMADSRALLSAAPVRPLRLVSDLSRRQREANGPPVAPTPGVPHGYPQPQQPQRPHGKHRGRSAGPGR